MEVITELFPQITMEEKGKVFEKLYEELAAIVRSCGLCAMSCSVVIGNRI